MKPLLTSMGGGAVNQSKKKYRLVLILGLITVAALVGAFLASLQVLSASLPSDRIPFDAKTDFALMAQAWNAIHTHYVDRASIKPVPLTYGAISGMVAALGDTGHSEFLSPEMIKDEEDFTAGKYEGKPRGHRDPPGRFSGAKSGASARADYPGRQRRGHHGS